MEEAAGVPEDRTQWETQAVPLTCPSTGGERVEVHFHLRLVSFLKREL